MKKLIVLFIVLLISINIYSQTYQHAIGVRVGDSPGISYKFIPNRYTGIETILHYQNYIQGVLITVLYEKHAEAFHISNLNWFYGAGAHIEISDGNSEYWRDRDPGKKSVMTIGVDGIVGLEYEIGVIPITGGLDFKPFLDIIGQRSLWADVALTIRYIIK